MPVYLRIVAEISERIASGAYGPGSRLPSESQFCAEFGASPMTIRRALTVLADQGHIWGEKGRGTFVRSLGLSDSVFRLDQLASEWLDESTEIRVLSASSIGAEESVATVLGIEPGTRVIFLRRLVLNRERPAMYQTEHVIYDPRRPLVESQLLLTSDDGLLESARGNRFPRGEIKLRAVRLDGDAAEALGEPEGAPALRLEYVFQDTDRRPVSCGRFFLRADVFQLRTVLGAE